MQEVQMAPLSEAEIDELNQLLFDYSEQVEETHGSQGQEVDCVFSISELDGFLTAVLTGPEPVSPSVWLPARCGAASCPSSTAKPNCSNSPTC